MSLSTFTCPMSHRYVNRIRVKEYDRMICGDLRENRKRWWKVRITNQPTAPMSTSAFPVLSWAADHSKRWHDIGKLPETLKVRTPNVTDGHDSRFPTFASHTFPQSSFFPIFAAKYLN